MKSVLATKSPPLPPDHSRIPAAARLSSSREQVATDFRRVNDQYALDMFRCAKFKWSYPAARHFASLFRKQVLLASGSNKHERRRINDNFNNRRRVT